MVQFIDTLCVQWLKSTSDIYAVWICGQRNPPSNPFCYRAYVSIDSFINRHPNYGKAIHGAIMGLPTRKHKPLDFVKVEYQGTSNKYDKQ